MPVSSEESVSSLWRSYQENYDGQRGPGLSTMSEWGFPAGVVLGSGLRALRNFEKVSLAVYVE